LKYIWSPWRMEYIQSDKNEDGCVFCIEMARPDGPQNLIVYRGQHVFLILNRFPYTSGHLMVVPYQHTPALTELTKETQTEMMEIANRCVQVLKEEYHPQGFNVGINIGEAAGAGITEHIHMHIVPRWSGDTNFMSSLGSTRVLPETLEETYKRVKEAWEKVITGK
jgi:ATP adenylyltransferase